MGHDSHPVPSEGAPLDRLRAIVALLRGPGGCPWDREQTHTTLRGDLLEEAYEVVEAIDTNDDALLREELGDLLLQAVMHSQIAAEQGRFTFDDVASGIAEKLVRRHPHVFGGNKLGDTGAVLKQWDQIKRAEKGGKGGVLDGVSAALPALMRAQKIQKKAARVGFDWPDLAGVYGKVREETAELEAETGPAGENAGKSAAAVRHEVGDLLFAAVNLARKLHVDAEVALNEAVARFTRRFELVELGAGQAGKKLEAMTLAEMDALWDEAKRVLGAEPPASTKRLPVR